MSADRHADGELARLVGLYHLAVGLRCRLPVNVEHHALDRHGAVLVVDVTLHVKRRHVGEVDVERRCSLAYHDGLVVWLELVYTEVWGECVLCPVALIRYAGDAVVAAHVCLSAVGEGFEVGVRRCRRHDHRVLGHVAVDFAVVLVVAGRDVGCVIDLILNRLAEAVVEDQPVLIAHEIAVVVLLERLDVECKVIDAYLVHVAGKALTDDEFAISGCLCCRGSLGDIDRVGRHIYKYGVVAPVVAVDCCDGSKLARLKLDLRIYGLRPGLEVGLAAAQSEFIPAFLHQHARRAAGRRGYRCLHGVGRARLREVVVGLDVVGIRAAKLAARAADVGVAGQAQHHVANALPALECHTSVDVTLGRDISHRHRFVCRGDALVGTRQHSVDAVVIDDARHARFVFPDKFCRALDSRDYFEARVFVVALAVHLALDGEAVKEAVGEVRLPAQLHVVAVVALGSLERHHVGHLAQDDVVGRHGILHGIAAARHDTHGVVVFVAWVDELVLIAAEQ